MEFCKVTLTFESVDEIWKFGGNLPLATLAVKGLITGALEKRTPDL